MPFVFGLITEMYGAHARGGPVADFFFLPSEKFRCGTNTCDRICMTKNDLIKCGRTVCARQGEGYASLFASIYEDRGNILF